MSYNNEYVITKIINYLRRSRQDVEREKRTGEDTLAQQEKLMDRVLTDFGVPYTTRKEIGSGDKIETRPVFTEILEILESDDNEYDAIAVKEISRLGRGSYSDMGRIFDLLESKRLYIITPHKIYDITNTDDRRQIRFELFLSREEFERTRERLTGARYNLAMEGKWVAGSPPYGYEHDKRSQRLKPHPKQSEVIKLIFDMYVNGMNVGEEANKEVSFRAIATFLTRAGYPTPNGKSEWSYISVQRILTNKTYLGQVKYRTTQRKSAKEVIERPLNEHIYVDDAHEALIDEETFQKAQEKYQNRNKTHNTKLDFSPCELASLLICSTCGRKMVRNYSVQHYKKEDGTTSVYKKEFLSCRKVGCTFLKYREVEEAVLSYLKHLESLNDEELKIVISQIVDVPKKEISKVDDLIAQVESKRKELENRLEFIYQKHESGIYDDDEFLKRKNKIKEELDNLNKVIIKEEDKKIEEKIDVNAVKNNVSSLIETYYNISNKTEKNYLLRNVFDHIFIERVEKGRGRRSAKFKITPYLTMAFAYKK